MIGFEVVNRVVLLMRLHVGRETSFLNFSDYDWFYNSEMVSVGRLDLV